MSSIHMLNGLLVFRYGMPTKRCLIHKSQTFGRDESHGDTHAVDRIAQRVVKMYL